MIDWEKPIETVPDARNPEPVPCEFCGFDAYGNGEAFIRGDWFTDDDSNYRDNDSNIDDPWVFNPDGTSGEDWLPDLRNVT